MTDYNFENHVCSKCHAKTYCIEWTHTHKRTTKTAFYCELCFGWIPESAQVKDDINQIMVECGIEPIHDIRDLD